MEKPRSSGRGLFLFNEFGLLMWFYEARPAGFEPATRGLEVRNELTAGNDLKQEERLSKPNPLHLRLLDVSDCLYGLESTTGQTYRTRWQNGLRLDVFINVTFTGC